MQKQWFYLVALVLAACAGASSAPDAGLSAAQTAAARNPVEFETLARGAYSTLRFERMQAITDNETLATVWQQVSADAPPVVDFARDMVVLVASGEHRSGGYSIVVTDVEQDGANLYVQVQLRSPGDACVVSEVLTQPYHLITLARSALPVQFEITHEVIDCGGGITKRLPYSSATSTREHISRRPCLFSAPSHGAGAFCRGKRHQNRWRRGARPSHVPMLRLPCSARPGRAAQ